MLSCLYRYEALEAPLAEKAVELDLAMQFFQFDRDVDDEKVLFFLLQT